MLAYWFLRQMGYTIVARNQRAKSGAGEVDLIGWDGEILAFVEVKTRTSDEAGPPEDAVSRAKQKRIVKAAREYLRRAVRKEVNYRFDIVSVSWDAKAGFQPRLIRDAFKDKNRAEQRLQLGWRKSSPSLARGERGTNNCLNSEKILLRGAG